MKRHVAIVAFVGLSSTAFSRCGGEDGGTQPKGEDCNALYCGPHRFDYVVSKIKLPMNNRDFAIDLNGDGKVDNQFGNILGTLGTQNLDSQKSVDQSIAGGRVLLLLSYQTTDPTLWDDDYPPISSGATIYLGKKADGSAYTGTVDETTLVCSGDCPKFDETGTFAVDTSVPPSDLYGKLRSGKFVSSPPVTALEDDQIKLKISLGADLEPLSVTIHGANIQFTAGKDELTEGQIHGSIKNTDVQQTLIPAITTFLTRQVAKDPSSSTAKQILSIFDTGGCTGATAGDGQIDSCELASNSIIQAVLAPDVQVYDASGNYKPSKTNTMKDSLSFAIGFEAVKATITGK